MYFGKSYLEIDNFWLNIDADPFMSERGFSYIVFSHTYMLNG